MRVKVLLLLLLFFAVFSVPAYGEIIGSVKTIDGQGWIIRADEKLSVSAGQRLHTDDVIQTDSQGSIGIILQDDTVISMGPGSKMVLDEFVFNPEKKRYGMLVRFIKGTFTYLSGVMAKLAPENVQLETPDGMVAVRGTHLLIKVEG